MGNAMYSKQHLLAALEKKNLPHSYKSLLQLERKGVIPKANNAVGMGPTNTWRLYTEEEINEIVNLVETHIRNQGAANVESD